MFRKGISIVVMLGFVAGQLATLPHEHVECAVPVDHDARPHVHTSCVGGAEHCDAHHHHVADARITHSQPLVSQAITEQHGHDSDAVYLASDMSVFLASKISSVSTGDHLICAVTCPAASSLSAPGDYSTAAFFPNE